MQDLSGLRPITLSRKSGGSITIPTPVYLAPMSGVSDLPFRRLAHRLGAPITVSEMIASNEALRHTEGTAKRVMRTNASGPSIVQLAGHDPAAMAETARFAVGEGADIIDLNFGCPAKKVTSKYCGSALMREPAAAAAIMSAVVAAVDAPVTVKMRTGWDAEHRNAPEIARIARETGIGLITVHGRTRDQKYGGTADWRFIRTVREAVDLPLIVNGDIISTETARRALRESGADGVMIGRGAQGKPWLPAVITAGLTGVEEPGTAPPDGLSDIVAGHFEAMLRHHGAHRGLRMARKHLGWYAAGLPDAARFRDRVMKQEDPARVLAEIQAFFSKARRPRADQGRSILELAA
ncbi:MAG: tRNA dihydrouridine synthase DusB [Alphaproteobacteria bacterium]|nr:tRNA dihydrouridine synthase DusB [Alphaproteobacteria bacterium]